MKTDTRNYKNDFKKWVKENNIQVFSQLQDSNLKIGDIVTFTNEYGLIFENLEILGFRNNQDFRPLNCVYLNKSSYWFALKLSEIKLQLQ